jgi:hypothetical protein
VLLFGLTSDKAACSFYKLWLDLFFFNDEFGRVFELDSESIGVINVSAMQVFEVVVIDDLLYT